MMHRKLIVDICSLPHASEVTAEDLAEGLSEWLGAEPGEVTVTEAFTLGTHD